MGNLAKIVEALLYVFGLLCMLMAIVTVALGASGGGFAAESAAGRGLGVLALLYTGLPAFGIGAISLGLGATITSIENLRRDTILVASTRPKS